MNSRELLAAIERDERDRALIGLARLLAESRFVVFHSPLGDHDDAEEPASWCIEAIAHDGKRRCIIRTSAFDCVRAAAGCEPKKTCTGPCKQELPLVRFSKNATTADGYCHRCQRCETARVAEYVARKRAQRAAQPAQAEGQPSAGQPATVEALPLPAVVEDAAQLTQAG